MRICLFTDTYFPDTCKRSTYIKTLYDGLVARGNRVMIVVPELKEGTLFVEDGVMHCPAKKLPPWQVKKFRLLADKERFRRIKEFNPDILHAHDCSALGFFALHAAKRSDLPLMYTFHDPDETHPDDAPPPEPDSKSPRALYQKLTASIFQFSQTRATHSLLTFADLITSPSGNTQALLKSMNIDRKIEHFPASVNSAKFHPMQITEDEKWSIRNRLGLSEDNRIVLFAGVLSPDKNLGALLSIWARRLRDDENLRFVIAGSGSEQQPLTEASEKAGIADKVIFTGPLSHDEMAVLYSITTVYLSALVSDTIPLSMQEALSVGVPVLLKYDPDNLGHIIERQNGFFFRSGKEMATLIRQFSVLSEQESGMIREAVRKSAKDFGAEDKTDALIDAYNRAISRHYNGHE